MPRKPFKVAMTVLLLFGMGNLADLTLRSTFKYHSHPRNPYAYTQTVPDLMRLVKRIEEIAAIHPDGKAREK